MIDVPVDIYTSSTEILIVIPVGGTRKESISLTIEENHLIVGGERELPYIKDNAVPLSQQCFWGVFEKRIELPDHVYFDKIHSELSPSNILTVTIPKVIKPDSIPVKIL